MANGRNTVSPLDYGLNEARNGEETYYVLLKCHQDAVRRNCGVSYAGINDLFLEIPINAMPIPLTYFTDFAGVSLIVKIHTRIWHYLVSLNYCYQLTPLKV